MAVKFIEMKPRGDGYGDPMRRAEFNSYQAAWKSIEWDYLLDRRCPLIRITRIGMNWGTIIHWGVGRDERGCTCKSLVNERLAAMERAAQGGQ